MIIFVALTLFQRYLNANFHILSAMQALYSLSQSLFMTFIVSRLVKTRSFFTVYSAIVKFYR